MISIVLSVRNTSQSAAQCLSSLLRTQTNLGTTDLEYVLIDDASDPQQQIPALLAQFRQQLPQGVRSTVLRFKEHQHYTRALALGFSVAKGRQVLFVSHDMLVTAEYVRTLLAVAASDDSIGLVRGTSPYVDCFPQHQVRPPFQIRSFDDLDGFAGYVAAYWGLHHVEDHLLTGDSMLIKREVFDKIGVFDPRYFGYFGDVDFGVRVQRAGFKMVCAKGAWLWHEGAGAYRDLSAKSNEGYEVIHANRMRTVNDAYVLFREKWDLSLPPQYQGVAAIDFARLRAVPPPSGGEYQPPIPPDPAICEVS
jgi:GT2 family glycosyltransferase